MSVNFWIKDPSVLIDKNNLMSLWPSPNMSMNEKLNSISRLIIILTIFGFFITRSVRILVTGLVTLGVIIFLYFQKNKSNDSDLKLAIKENFANPLSSSFIKKNYKPSNPTNPLSNVNLPEIQFNPNRKSAAPAFNPDIESKINENTKEMVQKVSFPEDPSINEKLFKDLGDDFNFERSMRNFYSTPNTKVVPGDQKAFAEFLYGDMISCKDGDPIACERNSQRYIPGY